MIWQRSQRAGMLINFTGYSADCLVSGSLELTAPRLTDMLNDGLTPTRSLEMRGPMLPLTDATIAYVVGGILEVRDASTVIVNRDLAAWVRATDGETDDQGALAAELGYAQARR